MYGTKRASYLNLFNGIKQSFAHFPDLQYLLITEDDILFSNDTLEFFERCKEVLDQNPDMAVATTYNLFRLYVPSCE